MAGRFDIQARFTAVDAFARPLTRMGRGVVRLQRHLKGAERAADKLTGGFRRAALGATAIGVAAGAVAMNVGRVGADFEQAITNVGAVGLKTRNEIKALEDQAKHLGATTKFTATEAAQGMEIMAKAGFSTQDILSGIPGVLDAAAASGLELAEVSDHVSNVLKGMGLATSESTRVADVLALASSRTNSTIGTLGESMRNVASTARQLKIPLESVVAGVASLQDVGLDASVAGSAMNTMLTKLAKPPAAVARQMKKFGISFKDAKGDMLPFEKVIEQISIASKKAGGNFDQVAFLADLVGLRGQKAAANLKDLFESGKLSSLTKELQNAEGSAKKMADLRMKTLGGDVTLLGSAIDAVKVALFETQSGPLRGIVQDMTKWVGANRELIVSGFADFIQKIKDNLPAIAIWAKRIGVALAVLGSLVVVVKVVGALVSAFMAIVPILKAIGILFLPFIAALALVNAALIALVYFFPQIWQGIKDGVSAVGRFFAKVWAVAVDTVKALWAPIGDFFSALWGAAKAVFVGYIEFVVGLATVAVRKTEFIWRPLLNFYTMLWDGVKAIASAFWEHLLGQVRFAYSAFLFVWTPLSAFFSMLWGGISSAASSVWASVVGYATSAYNAVVAVWSSITGFFAGLWDSVVAGFKATLGPIFDAIVSGIGKIQGIGRGTLDGEDADGNPTPGVGPQVVTPSERVSRSITESNSRETVDLNVNAPPGVVSMAKKPKGRVGVRVQASGAF